MSKLKAVALYDYDPEVADELKLRVGDVLTNIKKIEDGWCQGVLNGRTGMFPDNFVKLEEDKTPPPKPPSTKRKEAKHFMRATFAYEPQNGDELELKMDDIVEILKEAEEGWAFGSLNGRKGVFPTNFCAPYTPASDPAPDADKNKDADHHEPAHTAPPKKVQGVGFGNIFGDGPIKLKKSLGADNKAAAPDKPAAKPAHVDKPVPKHAFDEKPANHEKPSTKHSSEGKTPLKPPSAKEAIDKETHSSGKKSKPVEKCRVVFDYDATTGDELNLKIGEIITIITKECEDDGWWEGEKTDKNGKKLRGVFPDNFVASLPPEEPEVEQKPSVKEAKERPTTEAKPKVVVNTETEQNEAKEKPTSLTTNHSVKKQAPRAPPASLKPEPQEDSAATELDAVVDSMNDDHQLMHYRRVSGPKNRRRPDSTGRRERAKEAAEEAEAVPPQEDNEPDSPKPVAEPATPPQVAPKKEAPRGIQVIPIPGGGEKTGEKPAWLKNLKRTSQKKEIPPKPEEPANETPDWLANIRKKPKPVPGGDKATSPVVPSKPGPAVTSPKPVGVSPTSRSSMKSASHPLIRPSSPAKPEEKPTSVTRKISTKKEFEPKTAIHESEDSKKHPLRPPVPSQHASHPAELPKKPPTAATKPKPPSKAKPAVPSAKPHPASASIDELKEEMKALKEQISNFQKESMKEISRLSSEIDEEKRKRIELQSEVANLSKKLG